MSIHYSTDVYYSGIISILPLNDFEIFQFKHFEKFLFHFDQSVTVIVRLLDQIVYDAMLLHYINKHIGTILNLCYYPALIYIVFLSEISR